MENKVGLEAPVAPPECSTFTALLGATFVAGCGAVYLCYRWKRYVEGNFNDLNALVEEVTESVSYIKHRLKTRDCCTCHEQVDVSATGGEHGSEEHHCDKTEFLQVVDKLLQSHFLDVEEAYYLLKGRISEMRDDPSFLIRLARASHILGCKHWKLEGGGCALKRKMYLFEAQKYAALALKLNRCDPETNKWYAITLGSLTAMLPFRQRIRNLPYVKCQVERALEMLKNDPVLHHVLGRWHFEIATMSFAQRTAAWLWLGFSQTSTLREARQHLMRSHNLLPLWKENHLYIAKSHALEHEIKNAIRWAERGLLMPSKTALDRQTEAEIGKLLETLCSMEDDNTDVSNLAMHVYFVSAFQYS